MKSRRCSLGLFLGLASVIASRPLCWAQFETRGSAVGENTPSSLFVADFNHDGKLDFADADEDLLVFLGNGDGTFQSPANYLVGTGALYVAAADFNHDGKLDLAVADLNGFYILLGNGDGTFQTPVLYTNAFIPINVFSGNFNGDKNLDLLVNYSSGNCQYVSVYLGNGDGSFQQTPINSTPTMEPAAVGIGDFNGDGKLDVAVAQQFAMLSQVEIMLGNGKGSFSNGPIYTVGSFPTAVTTADFRNNGKTDVAVATLYGGTTILLGNGDGTFTQGGNLATPEGVWLLSADFNGDGKPDLAVTEQGFPAGVNVLLGNGDGTFQAPTLYLAGKEANFVASGDFNGDHKTDLLVTDYGPGDVVVLLNTGVASFSPTTEINFPFQLVGASSPAQTVTLTNTGTTSLSVSSMKATAPFSESNNCGKKLAAGAKCEIKIAFEPQNTNTVTGTVTVTDSGSSKPQVIEVTGTGTVVKLAPLKLVFGDQKTGTKSSPQAISVTNEGSAPMNLTGICIGGANYQDFSQTNNCPTSLNSGSACEVMVTFDPNHTGARSGLVEIYDSGGASPQSVILAGTGD